MLEHCVQGVQQTLCSLLAIFWLVCAIEKGTLLRVDQARASGIVLEQQEALSLAFLRQLEALRGTVPEYR